MHVALKASLAIFAAGLGAAGALAAARRSSAGMTHAERNEQERLSQEREAFEDGAAMRRLQERKLSLELDLNELRLARTKAEASRKPPVHPEAPPMGPANGKAHDQPFNYTNPEL